MCQFSTPCMCKSLKDQPHSWHTQKKKKIWKWGFPPWTYFNKIKCIFSMGSLTKQTLCLFYFFSLSEVNSMKGISKSPFQARWRALTVNAVQQSMAYGFAKNIWMISHHYFGDNNLKLWKQKRKQQVQSFGWALDGSRTNTWGLGMHHTSQRIEDHHLLLPCLVCPTLDVPWTKELPSSFLTILQ